MSLGIGSVYWSSLDRKTRKGLTDERIHLSAIEVLVDVGPREEVMQWSWYLDLILLIVKRNCHNTVCWDTINERDTRSDKRATHTSVTR